MRALLAAAVLTLLAVGCRSGKPSEAECKEAVEHIRGIVGLDTADVGTDPRAMVRSCRARSTKDSVKCVLRAETLADLEACEGEVGVKYMENEEQRRQKAKEKKKDEAGDENKDEASGDGKKDG